MEEVDPMENEIRTKQDNLLPGIVGALLGSLLGVACIVLLDRLGYVAAVSGVIMAVCSLKGYEMLGGSLSRRGVIVSSVIMVIMTFFGNQLGWAFAAADALDLSFWEAYRGIMPMLRQGVIDAGAYWGNLVLLYLFTLLGAVPTVHNRTQRDIPLNVDDEQLNALDLSDMELYTANSKAVRKHSFTLLMPLWIGLVLFFVVMLVGSFLERPILAGGSMMVVMVMLVSIIVLAVRDQACTQAGSWHYVRHNGRLWRINWMALNTIKGLSFSKRNLRALVWDKMPLDEQDAARTSIFRAVALQEQGLADKRLTNLVTELGDVRPDKEKPFYWVTTCTDAKGHEHLWKIGKMYPGFTPDPAGEPLTECCKPRRVAVWVSIGLMALSVVLSVALSFTSEPAGGSSASSPSSPLPDSEPTGDVVIYQHDGLRYELDASLIEEEPGVYTTAADDLYFIVGAYPDITQDDAEIWMELSIDEFCTDPSQLSYEIEPTGDTVLQSVQAATGRSYLYNRARVATSDGPVVHSALLYDPELKVLVTIDALEQGGSEDQIKTTIHQIGDSLHIDSDAVLSPSDELAKLTEENYQTFFAPAKDLGYELVGRTYFKGPADVYDGYTDAYLPFGDQLTYSADGTRVSSRAHGMEVECFFVTDQTTAKDAVKVITEAYQAENSAVSAGEKSEILWEESLDVGIQQLVYLENDQPRFTLMYADRKDDGCYMCARITYIFEEMDDLTPAVQTELSDAYALELPPLTAKDVEN